MSRLDHEKLEKRKKIKTAVHSVVWEKVTVKCFMHNAELSQLFGFLIMNKLQPVGCNADFLKKRNMDLVCERPEVFD